MQKNKTALLHFQKICGEHQVRITPQRTELFLLLADDKSHPSTDEIYQRLHILYPHISFNTVFITLQLFVQIGLLKETESYDGVKRFDPNGEDHGHFHCQGCGRIFDFPIKCIEEVLPWDTLASYQIQTRKIVLEGLCRECFQKT